MAVVEFWYEFASTYSYPAAMRIEALAAQRGIATSCGGRSCSGRCSLKPAGAIRPFNLYPAKGRYMWRDMERICASLGLKFRRPDPFPQNSLLAARVAVSLGDEIRPEFSRRIYLAEFAEGRAISERAVIAGILNGNRPRSGGPSRRRRRRREQAEAEGRGRARRREGPVRGARRSSPRMARFSGGTTASKRGSTGRWGCLCSALDVRVSLQLRSLIAAADQGLGYNGRVLLASSQNVPLLRIAHRSFSRPRRDDAAGAALRLLPALLPPGLANAHGARRHRTRHRAHRGDHDFRYVGALVDMLRRSSPAEVFQRHGGELVKMAFVVLGVRPLAALLHDLVSLQAIAPGLTNLVRWQAHRYLLRQTMSYFANDFAGRIASNVLQTGVSLRNSVVQAVDALWFVVVFVVASLIILGACRSRASQRRSRHGSRLHRRALRFRAENPQPLRNSRRQARDVHRPHRRQLRQYLGGEAVRPHATARTLSRERRSPNTLWPTAARRGRSPGST